MPKHCQDAPIPSHGLGIGLGWDTNEVGTTVSFQCNWGYHIVGPANRTCQNDTQWSGSPTFCTPTTESPTPSPTPHPTPSPTPAPTPEPWCDEPVAPANSIMSGGGHMIGDHVYFQCKEPAQLLGPSHATCRYSSVTGGSWTGFPHCAFDVQVCSHISCRQRAHSTLLSVRVEVNHGNCAAPSLDEHGNGRCDEQVSRLSACICIYPTH